jgi:mRNA-degrading endonuclease RelE of RelBE toxin-antitoxin system
MAVLLSEEVVRAAHALSPPMQDRVFDVIDRLERWPEVSGVKWLTGEWKNHARIRTGDYRVVFHLRGPDVVIDRIAHRRDAYAE